LYYRWKNAFDSQGIDGLQPKYRRVDPAIRNMEKENERSGALYMDEADNCRYPNNTLSVCFLFSFQTTEVYARAVSKQKRDSLERAYTDMLFDKTKDREWQKNQTLLDWLKGLQKK
jgi:hypothetical protein